MGFRGQDFAEVLDFVRDLYDQRGLEDFADRTMGSLLRIISADRIIYGDFDIERQAARLSMQPSVVKDQDGTVEGAVNGALKLFRSTTTTATPGVGTGTRTSSR